MRFAGQLILLVFVIQTAKCQQAAKADAAYRAYHKSLISGDTLTAQKTFGLLQTINTNNDTVKYFLELAQADAFLFKKEHEKAFVSCTKALDIAGKLKSDSLIFRANYLTGELYMQLGDLISALRYFNKCLLVIDSIENLSDRVLLYKEVALLYSYLYKSALSTEYFLKAEPLAIKLKNKRMLGNIYNNIAINYVELKNFSKALFYYRNCLAIRTEIKDEYGIAQVTNNFGTLYYEEKQYDLALKYFLEGRELRKKVNVENSGIIESNTNIGKTYNKLGKTGKAIQFLEDARKESINEKQTELERRAIEELFVIYSTSGDYKKAFELQSRYFVLKDSLYGLSKKEEITRLGFENKLKTDSLKHNEERKKELAIHDEKEKRSSLIRNISVGGFLMVLMIAFVLYKQIKRIRFANKTIEKQKNEIEIKQKEVMDSIYYARRIQRSLLTSERYIAKTLKRLSGDGEVK